MLVGLGVYAAANDVPWWGQWGRNPAHTSAVSSTGQLGANIQADIVYDPFTQKEEQGPYSTGDLLVHYQTPLVDGADVFMEYKTGQFSNIKDWQVQTWGEEKFTWVNGVLTLQWQVTSDWKPVPFSASKDGPGWEPVFHGTLTSSGIWVPGFAGGAIKLDRGTGAVLAKVSPFAGDANTYTVGPLSSDSSGNIYYNVMQLDGSAKDPWTVDVPNSWLVKVTSNGVATSAPWASLVPGAPGPKDQCPWRYSTANLPWPVLNPDGTPAPTPTIACGSQRPPVNTAPAIGPDGTIYDVSRAALNDYHAYLIAINPNLTPRWASSLRNRFRDGCGTPFLPPTGSPGGCRAGAPSNISPPDGLPGSGRVIDDSTAAPVIAPDGSIYLGVYTRYNYAQGHMMHWGSDGTYLPAAPWGGYQFGWDITPGISPYTAADGSQTFAVITKENHYGNVGSYCNNATFCPPDRNATNPGYPEQYFISSLKPDLGSANWRWQNTNHDSCTRGSTGAISCTPNTHPFGFEWCVNSPGIDGNGTVFANSEDGNLYEITSSGTAIPHSGPNSPNGVGVFTNLAVGAAYTPLSIGPDGRIYTQNNGHLFVIGN